MMALQAPTSVQYNVDAPQFTVGDTKSLEASQTNSNQTQETSILQSNSSSTPDQFDPSSYERGFITSANVGILLCSVGILFNGILFVVLCRSRRLRLHYLYVQISSIALADLSYIVMVDCFTVYFEMQPWKLGAAFCKAWMILDVALPAVSLLALLLLNMDRVLFTYKNSLYYCLMRHPVSRLAVILTPWLVSGTVVCSLWLGFPQVQPQEGMCMYGITEEANSASSWLMVFLPSLFIFVLIIFIFIAFIGEMPPVAGGQLEMMLAGRSARNACQFPLPVRGEDNTQAQASSVMDTPKTSVVYSKDGSSKAPDASPSGSAQVKLLAVTIGQSSQSAQCPRLASRMGAVLESSGNARTHRRFIAALLAVDFFSLAITLPYSASSLVTPICTDAQSCESLHSLFQTLGWMRSSAACVRPLLFILLTDIWISTKHSVIRCYTGQAAECSSGDMAGRLPQDMNLQIQLHERHQRNGNQGKGAGGESMGAMASDRGNPNTSVILDDGGDLETVCETSVIVTNCSNSTPPSSPAPQKQGNKNNVNDTDDSNIKNENRPTLFSQWLHEDTAATAV